LILLLASRSLCLLSLPIRDLIDLRQIICRTISIHFEASAFQSPIVLQFSCLLIVGIIIYQLGTGEWGVSTSNVENDTLM